MADPHRGLAGNPGAGVQRPGPGLAGRVPHRGSPRSATTSPTVDGATQDARLDALPEFRALLYRHACEGAYGAPEYGGNRDQAGWRAIGFPGDVQPRGYTDVEVSGRA